VIRHIQQQPCFPDSLPPLTIAGKLMILLLILSSNLSVPARAQVATGDLLGAVKDSSGAAVPNAAVRIENTGTHLARETKSGDNGEYIFTQLQPGTYKLTIAQPGFKTFTNPSLVLVAGDRARIDARLLIGGANETVEVTTEPSALQTDSTNVGTNVEAKAIADLPLNGRNVYNLVQLSPGVNAGSPSALTSGSRPDDRRQTSAVSANGQYELVNNNLIDGLDNNERFKGLILLRKPSKAVRTSATSAMRWKRSTGV
jgi:hypothetical protein